ncbi:18S rRNA (guanine-N(7))-methyltransferase RID2 isoform X2 [Aristolochia californica]|uniref:18S rRNA (guanine-N(7))-methyltransferase RID2 isoform X2 n=1 Tax=Aristolochia californica TaxID=171875 RepID=UPI0035E37BBA
MPSRPEFQAPPEFFYNDQEARKYTTSSRIIEIQAKLTERALELLALPDDGVPRLLLDIGCGSGLSGESLSESGNQWIGLDISQSMLTLEREVDGDLLLADMGQGLGLRPGVFDGAISISAVQWLCNADKSSNEPRLRLKAFFVSLYRCLARGARAVLQLYHENEAQLELITTSAMRAGFAGGLVVDFPHSTRAKKTFLVLTCGPPSISTALPKAKVEDGESCSDESSDEENQTVSVSDRHRSRKKQKINKKGKGRDWVLKKKEQMRKKGHTVPPDTKYTARKRKARF